MRRLAPLILAATCALLAPATARADTLEPEGIGCGYSTFVDPAGGDAQSAELDAGPLVVTGADGLPLPASVTCTLQVGAYTHDAPDAASATSATAPVAVLLAVVSYDAPPDEDLVLCMRVDVEDGPTLYWDGPSARWSTDPHSRCDEPIVCDDCGPYPPLDFEWVDAVVCPVLATAFPPEGDVAALWDCPPYGS